MKVAALVTSASSASLADVDVESFAQDFVELDLADFIFFQNSI